MRFIRNAQKIKSVLLCSCLTLLLGLMTGSLFLGTPAVNAAESGAIVESSGTAEDVQEPEESSYFPLILLGGILLIVIIVIIVVVATAASTAAVVGSEEA